QLRENGTDTRAIHLLVDFLAEVFFGRIGECTTTSAPDGRGRHTSAGATRAFLAPWLLGAVLDGVTAFLGTVATTGIGLESDNDLVHKSFVEFAAEHGVGSCNGGSRLTLVI